MSGAALNDRLRELGNIGCGRALDALSRLTDADFRVRVPDVEWISLQGAESRLGDAEADMVAVMLDVRGDIEGVFLTLLRPDIALRLLRAIGAGEAESARALSPRQGSALMELGNILCSSYMTAVADLTGLSTRFSTPSMAADMLGALLSAPVAKMAAESSRMLYIRNVFTIEGCDWIGCMMLMPSVESALRLGERLGALL